MSHLNKPSAELVLDLINSDNNRSLTDEEVRIVNPQNYVGNRNTQATVEAIDGAGYSGERTVYYNRLDLDVALRNNDPEGLALMVPNDGPVDTLEVADRLNVMFEYQIGPDDIVLEPVDTSTLPVEITIEAKTTSLAWYGSKTLTLELDRPLWEPTFSSTILGGFVFPDADVSELTEPTVMFDQTSSVTTPSGYLMAEAERPATHVTQVENGELVLELAVRPGDGTYSIEQDEDGLYELQVGTESTWSLLITGQLPATQVITDLYDTTLVLTAPDNLMATFAIERDDGVYTLVNDDLQVRVPMGYSASDGSAFQGLVEITYLIDAMGGLTENNTNDNGALLGIYSAQLQARRKNSLVPRLTTSATIEALNTDRAPDTSLVDEYDNADEWTFDWANLSGWVNTHLYVDNNRLYGNYNSSLWNGSFMLYPITVAADETVVLHGEFYATSGVGGMLLMGFGFGEPEFGPNGNSPYVALAGIDGTTNRPISFLGAAVTNQTTQKFTLEAVDQDTGMYRVTVVVDPENVSMVVRTEDGLKEWSRSIPRSDMPNGGEVTSIRIWNGGALAATGRYAGSVGVRKSLTPFRTKSNAAGVIEGTTERVFHRSVDDNWRIQFPKLMNGSQPTPIVIFCHQASSGTRNSVMTEARWTALRQSFSDQGYILVSADDHGDRWGNREALRNYGNLLRWVRKRVYVGKTFAVGYSMGGQTVFNAIANRAFGPISAAALISPVCDLVNMFHNPNYTATLQLAWGIDNEPDLVARSRGFNPLTTNPVKFGKVPYVINVSTNDTVVPVAAHTDLFEPLIRPYAISTQINRAGTGHGPTQAFDPNIITALFDEYL